MVESGRTGAGAVGTGRRGRGRRQGRGAVAVVAAAVLAGALLVGPVPAPAGARVGAASKATVAKVSDGTLAWGVSQYALGANPSAMSLAEVQSADPPATFVAGRGWRFTDGTGSYTPKTGAMTVSFPGALEFGNTSFGNYGFKFANPTVELDASGNGTITADVSVRPPGGAPFGAATVTVVADVTGATPVSTKKRVTVTVTPTAFSAPLQAAAGELAPFFQATGSSNDAIKVPEPATLGFQYKVKKSSKS